MQNFFSILAGVFFLLDEAMIVYQTVFVFYISVKGDWHQYDDIICAEPSKGVLTRIKQTFWPEQRKNLIQGREIAANVMLESIFDILRSWTHTNLKSFQIQLNQFFQVYANPFVFEEKQKKWYSLQFGEDDVSSETWCIESRLLFLGNLI